MPITIPRKHAEEPKLYSVTEHLTDPVSHLLISSAYYVHCRHEITVRVDYCSFHSISPAVLHMVHLYLVAYDDRLRSA